MVKVNICPRCGERTAGQIGDPPPCKRCGIAPRVTDVHMGAKEDLPRYLNWAGAGFLVLSVIIFILSALSIIAFPMWALLSPVMLSMILLILSLVMQRIMVREAIERSRNEPKRPPRRRLRPTDEGSDLAGSGRKVRSGKLETPARGRAVKIPIDR